MFSEEIDEPDAQKPEYWYKSYKTPKMSLAQIAIILILKMLDPAHIRILN